MDPICYLNGEFIPRSKCKLHISDLQFQRGYGVFDFFRTHDGVIPWYEDYKNRLFKSIELAQLETSFNAETLLTAVQELQERNNIANGAFKVIVTGGYSNTLDAVDNQSNVIILNMPWHGPSKEQLNSGIGVITFEFTRPTPEIKTLYYFNTLMLRHEMKKQKASEVLFHREHISEASRSCFFAVKGDTVYTPATGILKGITRKNILKQFPEIIETDIPCCSLRDFDELFLASTTREITPVVRLNGAPVGNGLPGKVTRALTAGFQIQ